MSQITHFPTPSPAPPLNPELKSTRRFSLQLHNPLPHYYGRRKRSIPEQKTEPDNFMKSDQLKAQSELLRTKQVRFTPSAQTPPTLSAPVGPRPMPRLPRAPLSPPVEPVDDRCRCTICQRAEAAQIKSDRLSRLSLTSDESAITLAVSVP
ncbi:hypothetical protein CcaverHIS002_0107130 [Cutaneotrichosporon cavernicola]|uniref:Uncharacterized protein n=1 Tax=Cutaneotrichosporon cavernicola TaxID=279322 RepID=A0AA48IBV4_9TREE|nr:uncharacterized protein CcaverHIS019_0107090 [Cutaneotrichosporon cavernicola]BEI80184.1 hypothetical protein CcaverHIS002_0107130 [Cutaneotrichosporon cavernicola]BEI87991.1 hypothetical protein CcaverHIS019_0107090 [Cutaneotrichosporon cavernicola]BEI95767.1 hypothetical protein CcaverHIS631_0107160 [Cutaneotrichosporon cavernicola]BEJ03539.1 hypothetical protein CcaverHIS641_0107140 [Cutaneotrichosporon cavernicola]